MGTRTERKVVMSATSLPFVVALWGSKPGTEDDCWTAADFATLEEARAAFDDVELSEFDDLFKASPGTYRSTAWIELDGPGVHEERRNPDFAPTDPGNWEAEWQQERAHQAGMGLGIQAYNDEMGW